MKGKNCILCKSTRFKKIAPSLRDSKKHQVVKCVSCEHTQLYPIPNEKENKKFYDKNLQYKNIGECGSLSYFRKRYDYDTKRRAKFVSNVISKEKRILEIGSGHGFFLESMHKNGFNISGIEISQEHRNSLKRLQGVKVHNINLQEPHPEIGKFDLIVMFHVLEHVLDPIEFLRNVKTMLATNGKIIVEVPNFDDYEINQTKNYKLWHFQRAHIHYFTPKTLKATLKKAGFKKIKIMGLQRYSIENMFNWKITGKPQIDSPTHELSNGYDWIERVYKKFLEDRLICDTIISISSKN